MPDINQKKMPIIKKFGLSISPSEMLEEPTIDRYFQNLAVREKNIMNPFHKKLERPSVELVEGGKSSSRKVFEHSVKSVLMLSEDTRKILQEHEDLLSKTERVMTPEDVDIDVFKLVADKKAEVLRKSLMETQEGGTEHKVVKPEDIEFDVFKAVESAESDEDSTVESKKSPAASEQPLKASDNV